MQRFIRSKQRLALERKGKRDSVSFHMPPISTSVIELTCNIELAGVTFRSIVESTIEAFEVALIGDTRQKELFLFV